MDSVQRRRWLTLSSPIQEDACSPNPLPDFQKLEMFCSLLVEIGLTEDKLSLTTEQRSAVEKNDTQPQRFNQLYRTHWSNTLYCRRKRDGLVDAAVMHRVKMAKLTHQHSSTSVPRTTG
ncbi:hypothetical protein SRHO_G00163380 [Serrasalmus rhombeus]